MAKRAPAAGTPRSRRPPVTATLLPAPAPPRPVAPPPARFNPFLHARPVPAPEPPLATPSGPGAGAPRVDLPPADFDTASPDLLIARYSRALGGTAVPDPGLLRVLLFGLLAEHVEVMAQRLDEVAAQHAREPLQQADAVLLRHAAQVLRGYGVRRMR